MTTSVIYDVISVSEIMSQMVNGKYPNGPLRTIYTILCTNMVDIIINQLIKEPTRRYIP